MKCIKCDKEMVKNGFSKSGKQKYICRKCGYNHEAPREFEEVKPETHSEKQSGITEAQLRAKHDNHYIIDKKCKELKPGTFLTNGEFIQFCGIRPGSGYRGIIEHPDYDKYHGRAGSIIYWAHPDSIKKLKDEGVLA